MSPVKVIDASALAAILFAEPDAERLSAMLLDATLIAPTLLDLELVQVFVKKLRRRQVPAGFARLMFVERDKFEIIGQDVNVRAVLDLAVAADLSAYDATYLLMARQFDAELITLDKKLQSAFDSSVGR